MKKPLPIILASTSPRRKALLKLLGLSFQIAAPLFEEESQVHLTPKEEALFFATEKARSIAHLFDQHFIIGSDTLIDFKGNKIGKPVSNEHAFKLLSTLRGQTHFIHTAVCLLDTAMGKEVTHLESIRVQMKNYSDSEIVEYLEEDAPFDKAGAYAIQGNGMRLMESFKGDFNLADQMTPLASLAETDRRKRRAEERSS